MFKCAIFDLDGTLADTMDDLMTAMNSMLGSFGYPTRTREELTGFINKGARKFVWQSLPDGAASNPDDELVTMALRVYSDFYAECYADKTHPYENITDALAELKAAGVRLGVLSNKQDRFVKDIVYKLFPGIFESVHGHLDLPEKPDPAAALFVASELGADPAECVFIGDSDIDMRTGLNAGMVPVGVTWGYRSRECLINAGAAFTVDTALELCERILNDK